jgi:hypothetical protein
MHWSNRANPFRFADLHHDHPVATGSQVLQINNTDVMHGAAPCIGQVAADTSL